MSEPKIAMKFSLAAGKANNSTKSAKIPTNLKRPLSALHDEEEHSKSDEGVQISAFDSAAGGAIDANGTKEDKLLVIARQPNRDWREESRKRQRSNIPGQAQTLQRNAPSADVEKDEARPAVSYGLTVVAKERQVDGNPASTGERQSPQMSEPLQPALKHDDDQLALEALLGEERRSDLVIGMEAEQQAFERDYNDAPDMASLDDYERVPVEEFGLALLRGMGWKDGQEIGKRRSANVSKARPLERRPALLGIGAKEDAAVGIELGDWGKAAKGKRKVDQAYNPVLLVNKDTGEKLTEEELKARVEQQNLIKEDANVDRRKRSPGDDSKHRSSYKTSRRYTYDDEDDERNRRQRKQMERERDRDRDGYRHNDRARDKDTKRDRDRERKRDHDQGSGRHRDSRHMSHRRDRSTSTDDQRKRKRKDYEYRDGGDNKRRLGDR